VLEQPLRNI